VGKGKVYIERNISRCDVCAKCTRRRRPCPFVSTAHPITPLMTKGTMRRIRANGAGFQRHRSLVVGMKAYVWLDGRARCMCLLTVTNTAKTTRQAPNTRTVGTTPNAWSSSPASAAPSGAPAKMMR